MSSEMNFPDTWPLFQTPRLAIRAFREDDQEAVFAIFSDPEVMRYWSQPPMTERAEAAEMIARALAYFLTRDSFRWAIARREDDRTVGTFSLFRLDRQNWRAEIGYALGRDHWGQGYMQEALCAVIGYAFRELNLLRLEADLDPRNAASARALERQGFRREGLLRERWIVGGVVSDSLLMGLLRREWEGSAQ